MTLSFDSLLALPRAKKIFIAQRSAREAIKAAIRLAARAVRGASQVTGPGWRP